MDSFIWFDVIVKIFLKVLDILFIWCYTNIEIKGEINKMYIGKILDGRWEIKKSIPNKSLYRLENIYNHQIIELSSKQVRDIVNGRSTVSKVITKRLHKNNHDNRFKYCISNYVVIAYARNAHKYAKERGC